MDKEIDGIPTPIELFEETVRYLEPSGCLPLIPSRLIANHAMAAYYLLDAQLKLTKGTLVGYNKNRDLVVSSFAEALVMMQKNETQTWQTIWDIVSQNSEKQIPKPEQQFMAMVLGGRVRSKPASSEKVTVHGTDAHSENTGE